MKKASPMLFTFEAIKEINDGKITEIVEPIYSNDLDNKMCFVGLKEFASKKESGIMASFSDNTEVPFHTDVIFPYGAIGDHLWTAEKWRVVNWKFNKEGIDGSIIVEYGNGEKRNFDLVDNRNSINNIGWVMMYLRYLMATGVVERVFHGNKVKYELTGKDISWVTPISMPEFISRLSLEITSVSVEKRWSYDADNQWVWVWVIEFKKIEEEL